MASLLHHLGAAAYRRRFLVLAAWLTVLVAAAVGAMTLSGSTKSSFEIQGQESTTALEAIDREFGSGSGASAQVVFEATDGHVTGRAAAARISATVAELSQLPGVASVTNPFDEAAPTVSKDRAAAYVTVTYTVPEGEMSAEEREALLNTVADAHTDRLAVEVSGTATVAPVEVVGTAEIIGVIVAFLVLALTYGALVAAGLNMITALIGVGTGVAGIIILTGFVDLQSTTTVLATMLGLAVGIDYALFLFSRFRRELRQRVPVPEAVAMATGTAGSAVVTAGITVVIALAGLAVVEIGFVTEMGLAAAATVVISVLAGITLVPAVLGIVGPRVLPKKERAGLGSVAGPDVPTRTSKVYAGWARFTTRRTIAALLISVVILGVAAIPVLSMRTSLIQPVDPQSTQGKAVAIVDDHFGPGFNGPLLLLVEGADAADQAQRIAGEANLVHGVAVAAVPTVSAGASAALITIVPDSAPSSEATADLVESLRDRFPDRPDADVSVTGQNAVSVDVGNKLADALPIYLALVVGLALVLLILVFRSILVPLVGVIGFLLTLGAAFGASVAVFQWGWLDAAFGVTGTGPLLSLMPILVVGILFGLAMDYQVFLVSSMHEAHAHGASPRTAIRMGFRRSAPVVVAAAAIMFAVFAGFIPSHDPTIKALALALSVGILADAFVVRMLLVPAAMSLLGDRAWALPPWLRWLPAIDVEGNALRRSAAHQDAIGATRELELSATGDR